MLRSQVRVAEAADAGFVRGQDEATAPKVREDLGDSATSSPTPRDRDPFIRLEHTSRSRYDGSVDSLRADDIKHYRALPPGERLRQALEMMREGLAMQRANLRRRHPGASEEEIERLLVRWMYRE